MQRETLSSRLGFIMLAAASAIGIGNIWKFPYITGISGGGFFVLLYICFLFLLGIPIVSMELGVGRGSGCSPIKAFTKLEPKGTKWHYQGWVSLIGSYLLMMFYTVVSGWMLHYSAAAIVGKFTGDLADGQIAAVFDNMLGNPMLTSGWMVCVVLLGCMTCGVGLVKGLEKVTKKMMILLLASMFILAANSLTLPGTAEGLRFYLVPDWERMQAVGVFNVLYNAMSQAFFTLSIGIGAMAIFGSYMNRERTLLTESTIIAALDTLVALVAGLIIFPACFTYNVEPTAGPGLLFISLPEVFNRMPMGQWWGALFFIFMSFASLSTVFAVFENIIACCSEQFGWSRQRSAAINFFIITFGSIPCVLGFNSWKWEWLSAFGGTILDLEDFIVSYIALPLGGLVYALFCVLRGGWGWEAFSKEANTGKGIRYAPWMQTYLTYILPLIILAVFIFGLCQKFHILS
ncbi:MAG: sodium-dependent transporter [Bacteroidaceae bacterium]|nr:sodium-dependent transporter [Bacteroidaceae bacterium]